jgi:hypothetical protein
MGETPTHSVPGCPQQSLSICRSPLTPDMDTDRRGESLAMTLGDHTDHVKMLSDRNFARSLVRKRGPVTASLSGHRGFNQSSFANSAERLSAWCQCVRQFGRTH